MARANGLAAYSVLVGRRGVDKSNPPLPADAAAETVEAYKRALELCSSAKSSAERIATLNGIIGFHIARAHVAGGAR